MNSRRKRIDFFSFRFKRGSFTSNVDIISDVLLVVF